ncbi:hypothetical protein BBJ28_00021909 [Nothophytophthora sp. Chile5]|nr:hypothetical protein BBJ28_00021909 [Nothophytophthora sp. Chile5]
MRRSRLLTEVAMRKMNLGPEKTEQMGLISDRLAPEDINFFQHIFRQIDSASVHLLRVTAFGFVGSKAIDLQEWVVLCGMLDIPVVVFRTKMQRILENAYAHLPECNQHEVSCYVDDILSALDPNNTECVDVQECIRILSRPYHAKLPVAVSQEEAAA